MGIAVLHASCSDDGSKPYTLTVHTQVIVCLTVAWYILHSYAGKRSIFGDKAAFRVDVVLQ